jgi:hypothetical protein
MDYSSVFIRRAAEAAQARRPGEEWSSLPIGQRVLLIYREMQRADAANTETALFETEPRSPIAVFPEGLRTFPG